MTEMIDRPHPQPLSQFGRGEKDVDRENLKIGISWWGSGKSISFPPLPHLTFAGCVVRGR
ncbi:hypothetical protein [Hydrococcus rivularis]|uniref:hypothetical protein n=1 Tax=Hydrococcus rivularis TaxID=1616834 RepID=UPI001114B7C7|nr:hypothetical protein [Hydrococcus rivularis]